MDDVSFRRALVCHDRMIRDGDVCGDCPLENREECVDHLLHECAIRYEPHILTAEEVRTAEQAVWMETREGNCDSCLVDLSSDRGHVWLTTRRGIPVVRLWKHYNETWRCWSSRPEETVPWPDECGSHGSKTL